MALLRGLLCVAALATAASQSLYEFSDSFPVVELNDDNFESVMMNDGKAMWVVEYYADWCGHCKAFAKGYAKAAENLKGIVKFGAVNADNAKKTVQAAGVNGYPTVKVYLPEKTRNPYTGKMMKTTLDYSGPRGAKGVVDYATSKLPSKVLQVTDATLGAFRGNGTTPKALLFTKKESTTPLLKALSLSLAGRMLLGEVRETATAAVEAYGVTDFPSLYVLGEGDGAAERYEGELKPGALAAFLASKAGPEPEPEAGAGGGDVGVDSLAQKVDAATVGDIVDGSTDAWLLAFGEVAGGVEATAEALYGQARVGVGAADLQGKYGVKAGKPTLVVLPHGYKGDKKKVQTFGADEAGLASAKKAVLETLPTAHVEPLHAQNLDQWMMMSMAATGGVEARAVCLLFSDKPSVPPLFRAVSLQFGAGESPELAFGMVNAADAQMMQRFGVDKAPALLIFFPDESKPSEKEGAVQMQGMKFTPSMHGKFNFGNIANFVASFVQQRLEQLGVKPGAGAKPKKEAAAPKKELGPLPELNAATFREECVEKGGLCAVALLDGSPDNANKGPHLEMLTALRKKKAGGPLAISWVDATCHTGFAAAFNIYETDLPAFIVFSPSKLKYARAIGAFDAESLGTFGGGVATGRIRTDPISELPPFEDVDCATLPRGAAAVEEEPLGDDIMAEILEEERREREAREAELAAEGVAAAAASEGGAPSKPKDQMSKLELLESEVEDCGAMDLLCSARREKQLKALEKERALQEKLAEIAKKKRKKAKKAKKKAAA